MAGRPAVLKVDILADAGKAKRELDDVDGKFGKFGASAAKAGKIAAAGLAVGLAAAGAAAFKLAQGAAEDEAAAARLAQTLKNTTGATDGQVASMERWISKQGEALGVTDDELRPAIEKLAGSTGSLKVAQEQASLAMDIAAGRGLSLESVAKSLEKANNGNVAGLAKLGIETKNAAGETLTLEQATGKLAEKYAGQASTAANTAEGKFGRLKLQMAELGEGIGGKLLPIGGKLADWALQMAPKVQKLAGDLGEKLGPAFRAVGGFISDNVIPAARSVAEWFAEKIAPAIRDVLTPVLGKVRDAFETVAGKIRENKEPLGDILSAAKTLAEFFAEKILPLIGKAVGVAFGAAGDAIGLVVDIIAGLSTGISKAVGWVQSLITWLGKIKVPSLGALGDLVGKVTGSTGNLTTPRATLHGAGPSYGTSWSGLSTASLGDSPAWASMSAGQLGAGGSFVDARDLSVRVQLPDNPLGLVDEAAVARRLQKLLSDHLVRIGAVPTFGTS